MHVFILHFTMQPFVFFVSIPNLLLLLVYLGADKRERCAAAENQKGTGTLHAGQC